jgi:hypothetical protein
VPVSRKVRSTCARLVATRSPEHALRHHGSLADFITYAWCQRAHLQYGRHGRSSVGIVALFHGFVPLLVMESEKAARNYLTALKSATRMILSGRFDTLGADDSTPR